ncbi:hypothetical protein [Cohnella abietis]|uniref:Uncharacterized protein n=1 Tax=Cohnella abietis TaxID=2507935 RepID=A0A3T1DEM3_9BACL|nr:hypothetical protein [Cohnella abietis]BBI36474.1 hypothetical protein KCTCHS21_58730 [Cohnella abietis]
MFPDLTLHPDFLSGQSKEWCEQLAAKTGKYEYPWKSNLEGVAAEDILTEKLTEMMHGKL